MSRYAKEYTYELLRKPILIYDLQEAGPHLLVEQSLGVGGLHLPIPHCLGGTSLRQQAAKAPLAKHPLHPQENLCFLDQQREKHPLDYTLARGPFQFSNILVINPIR